MHRMNITGYRSNKLRQGYSTEATVRSGVSEGDRSLSSATVDSGVDTTPSDRSPNQAPEKIVPPPASIGPVYCH